MQSPHARLCFVCAILFLISLLARGNDGSGVSAFCARTRSDFDDLVRLSAGERQKYWAQKADDAAERLAAKSKELQATSELLSREPNAKELQQVFAFDYLNETYETQLEDTTRLVEDLGRELLNDRISAQLTPMMKDVDAQFAILKGKSQAGVLQDSYGDFLQFQRRVADLQANPPVKETFAFEPRANAYASEPIKKVTYTIHDWIKALASVDELKRKLQPIQDRLQGVLFFTPKDPLPWLPVITQMTFLMVAMAGWIKSYHSDKAFWTIGVLVVASMLLSVFLVFYSQETLLNILRQSILPGLFILYWIGKSNNWFRRSH
jgi:hypothetical protein